MVEIKYQQASPRGNATLDSGHVLIGTDGKAWLVSGSPSNHGLLPLGDEQVAALRGHFGALWADAVDGVAALRNG